MKAEADALSDNEQRVSEQGKQELPFHAFISGENEDDYWRKSLTSYAEETSGAYFILDAKHYVHLDKPELIAEKSRELIEKTSRTNNHRNSRN